MFKVLFLARTAVLVGGISVGAHVHAADIRQIVDRNLGELSSATALSPSLLRLDQIPGAGPIQLTLNAGASSALDEEIRSGLRRYKAKAAAGLVLDVNTGEILALSSVSASGANCGRNDDGDGCRNLILQETFEFGSVQKLTTLALALDTGTVRMTSKVDARKPLRFGRYTIHDYNAQGRRLSIPEVELYSSNIAAARLARSIGDTKYRAFLEKLGNFRPLQVDRFESAAPRYPLHWTHIDTLTTSFGHGIAVSPLQAAVSFAALANDGHLVRPHLIKTGANNDTRPDTAKIIKPKTSMNIRALLRLNTQKGSSKSADIPGYAIGGRTGTSEKLVNGKYDAGRVLASFVGVLPSDAPKYLVMTLLDEPQGIEETNGYLTAAWNAAPTARRIIERVAPLLGIQKQASHIGEGGAPKIAQSATQIEQ